MNSPFADGLLERTVFEAVCDPGELHRHYVQHGNVDVRAFAVATLRCVSDDSVNNRANIDLKVGLSLPKNRKRIVDPQIKQQPVVNNRPRNRPTRMSTIGPRNSTSTYSSINNPCSQSQHYKRNCSIAGLTGPSRPQSAAMIPLLAIIPALTSAI